MNLEIAVGVLLQPDEQRHRMAVRLGQQHDPEHLVLVVVEPIHGHHLHRLEPLRLDMRQRRLDQRLAQFALRVHMFNRIDAVVGIVRVERVAGAEWVVPVERICMNQLQFTLFVRRHFPDHVHCISLAVHRLEMHKIKLPFLIRVFFHGNDLVQLN